MTSSSVKEKAGWTLLKVFVKSNKRKFLFIIINTVLIYIFLTSFFMLWFSNQNSMLQNYLSMECDWNKDSNISAYYSSISSNYISNYSNDFLESVLSDIKANINGLVPNLAGNSTSMLSFELYYFPDLNSLNRYQVNGFLPELNSILYENLLEGRLPNNSSEILYYKEFSSSNSFQLNETIVLQSSNSPSAVQLNFTVVGILNNLENAFFTNNLSVDILDWCSNIASSRYSYNPLEKFFTFSTYLAEIMDSYSFISTGRAVLVDFDYLNEAFQSSKLSRYLSQYQKELNSLENIDSDPQEIYTIGLDFYNSLVVFRDDWLQKTIIIVSLTFPLLILLSFLCYESFNFNQKEYYASLSLLQTLGLSKKKLSQIAVIEIVCFSLLGLIIGLLVSILMILPFSYLFSNNTYQNFFNFLAAPLFLFTLLAYTILYAIFGLIIELRKVRKIPTIKSIPFSYYEKNWIQKFFSIPEILISIPGLVAASAGILVLRFTQGIPSNYAFLRSIAWGILFFGLVLVFLVLFFIISRLIILLISWFGKKTWNKRKNQFTYSLKNVRFNNRHYKTMISFMMIFGLGIVPGVILQPLVTNQLIAENSLVTGGVDLIIESSYSDYLPNKIDVLNISGVEKISLITISTFVLKKETMFGERQYMVPILSIHNQTEFLEIVDFSDLNYSFTTEDVLSLENNLTFLMSSDYAKKNGYDVGREFTNVVFGNIIKPISFNYINKFNFFPFLLYPNNNLFVSNSILFSLVMNLNTSRELEKSLHSPLITKTYSILVKANSSNIISSIQQQIKYIAPKVDFQVGSNSNQNDFKSINFTMNFLIFSSIISFIVALLYSYITITNLLKMRTKAIEIEYTIGITKKQILRNTILEICLVAILPLIICSMCGIYFSKLIGTIITINAQNYSNFNLKFSFLFILAVLVMGIPFFIGWLLELIPTINKYHLVKEI
ncbi:MAG: FtsX-like permease family protein [Candidatus Thorarchaeota archaeon]